MRNRRNTRRGRAKRAKKWCCTRFVGGEQWHRRGGQFFVHCEGGVVVLYRRRGRCSADAWFMKSRAAAMRAAEEMARGEA